jgi:hypothetical protein
MDAKEHVTVQDEKASNKHVEESVLSPEISKTPAALETGDYAGAEKKTDPAEIALVRKIDWRLMVSPPSKNN